MPFPPSERKALLALKGAGPTVVRRLEQMGFHALSQLARADAREIVTTAAERVGSTCWKNSPQARTTIEAAMGLVKRSVRGDTEMT